MTASLDVRPKVLTIIERLGFQGWDWLSGGSEKI